MTALWKVFKNRQAVYKAVNIYHIFRDDWMEWN
jgi:hypothetical protein